MVKKYFNKITGAIVGQLADAVENEIDDFFADRVVTTGEIVAGILLAGDELLGMEELAVGASANLIDDGGPVFFCVGADVGRDEIKIKTWAGIVTRDEIKIKMFLKIENYVRVLN